MNRGLRALEVVAKVILTAAAIKAALGTLSRPMAGVGIAPSLRRGRLGIAPTEDYDETDLPLDYEDLL